MRRIHSIIIITIIVVTVGVLIRSVAKGNSPSINKPVAVKEVKVNMQALATNSIEKRYVVDLTTGGKIYRFDPGKGAIDFQRIVVQAGTGNEDFSSWLNKNFSTQLDYNPNSDILRVGKKSDFINSWDLQPAGTYASSVGFTCNYNYCDCSGRADCRDMLDTNVCGGDFFACTQRGGGVRCICSRRA
jgi:hypothetical protein